MITEKENFAQTHSDYAFEKVPMDQLQSWKQASPVLLGWIFATSNLLSGGIIGNQLPLKQAFLSIFVGNLAFAVVASLIARMGPETRLSTYVTTRYSFGKLGSKILSVIFGLTLIGWSAVGMGLAGKAATQVIPINEHLMTFILAVLMTSTALYGYKGLKFLSYFAVPSIIVICVIGLVKVLENTSIAELSGYVPKTPVSFLTATGVIFSIWFAAGISSPDITRYVKSKKEATIATFTAFSLGNCVLMWTGTILAVAVGNHDLVAVLVNLGFGAVGMLFLILVQWTTSDNSLYSGGLGLANFFNMKSKFYITLFAGSIGIILATLGIYNYFYSYLYFLGAFLAPIAGVILIDFYCYRKKYSIDHNELKTQISIPAIIAWGAGSLVNLLAKWGVPSLNGMVTALIIYFILMKVFPPKYLSDIE